MQVSRDRIIQILVAAEVVAAIDGSLGRRRAGSIPGRRQHEPIDRVIALYCDHGTHEQFHSEFKTDLDLERLPSGKFASNDLILSLAALTYNLLRLLGQQTLTGDNAPIRHPAKRRRIKTVMQELLRVAVIMTRHGRRLVLNFARHCPIFELWRRRYAAWSGSTIPA